MPKGWQRVFRGYVACFCPFLGFGISLCLGVVPLLLRWGLIYIYRKLKSDDLNPVMNPVKLSFMGTLNLLQDFEEIL